MVMLHKYFRHKRLYFTIWTTVYSVSCKDVMFLLQTYIVYILFLRQPDVLLSHLLDVISCWGYLSFKVNSIYKAISFGVI